MEKTPQGNKYDKIENKIKELLLIFNLVMTSAKNVNEFNTSEIILTENIKKENLKNFILSYKNKTYPKPSNLNNITISFIDLISNILSNYYILQVSHIQLLMAYDLVYIFHKDTSNKKIQEYHKDFKALSYTAIKNYSYYVEILKMIKLIKEEEEDTNIQYLNKCQIIKNLNKSEFNSNITTFLLKNDEIPQYKNIDFPKLNSKDDEKIFNNKIEEIANLFDVINASLHMNAENMRFQLYNKYINQNNEKLKAINQVLSSLKKKELFSLDEKDLSMKIELYKENCSFLKKENNKNNMSIGKLMKRADSYKNEVNTLKQTIKDLSQKIEELSNNLEISNRELSEEQTKNKNLNIELTKQENNYFELYEELQNIKYRDISNYIIDYFVCILNDKDYEVAMNSEYKDAVKFIVNEINNNNNYKTYNNLLNKEGISIENLLYILLKHKKKYNTITHGGEKEEEEFIRLILNFEDEKIANKFKSLFNKTPLLKKYCFEKRNRITRIQIKDAILNL